MSLSNEGVNLRAKIKKRQAAEYANQQHARKNAPCPVRSWNFPNHNKKPTARVGEAVFYEEAGYCYAGLLSSNCSALVLYLLSVPHYARYREIFVPLFELCACGMRHSVGFAALLPSQLRTP
jgi:hypothetical protein